jgi:hypothetical protein
MAGNIGPGLHAVEVFIPKGQVLDAAQSKGLITEAVRELLNGEDERVWTAVELVNLGQQTLTVHGASFDGVKYRVIVSIPSATWPED